MRSFILIPLSLCLYSCLNIENKNLSKSPNIECNAPNVGAFTKVWFVDTCNYSTHTGLFGCVITLNCSKNLESPKILIEREYGNIQQWNSLISFFNRYDDLNVKKIVINALSLKERIFYLKTEPKLINEDIIRLNLSLDSLPKSLSDSLFHDLFQ